MMNKLLIQYNDKYRVNALKKTLQLTPSEKHNIFSRSNIMSFFLTAV